ncbi:MAG: TonB-dependent receptor [Hellea sp.]
MQTKTFLKALLQTSAITAVAMGTAFAQDTGSRVTETTQEVEGNVQDNVEDNEVVVTGSRIRADTFSSPVSIDVLTVDEAKIEGIADIAGLLQTATAAAGSSQVTSAVSTAFVVNGGLGANTVGLRGLAANRTLDLINGRRAGPSGTRGSVSSFDLNSIPLVGVQRVDILKDGASSVYGSDAIAGVINYITDTSDNKEIDFYTEIPEEGGGEVFRGSATYGEVFDKGRFRITADYLKQKELARGDRDYLDCNENYSFTDASLTTRADVIDPRTGNPQCGGTIWGHVWVYDYGSDNLAPNPRNILLQYDYGNNLGGIIPSIPTSLDGSGVITPSGWFQVEYDQSHVPNNPAWAGIDVSNNGPNAVTNLYSPIEQRDSVTPETERFTFMFDGDYELTDNITAYGEALFNRRTNYANAHKQYWTYQYGETSFTNGAVNNANPIAAGWGGPNTWFSPTPIVEHGDQETKIDYIRLVGGLKGDFGDAGPLPGWNWDVYGQHSISDAEYSEQYVRGDAIFPYNFQTDVCSGNSPGNSITLDSGEVVTVEGRPCVDLRWFDPDFLAGNLTEAEKGFLLDEDTGTTKFTQTTIEGFATGDVIDVPAGSISAALGVFYQRDEINDRPSDATLTGAEFFGSQAGITTGVQSTKAIFGEINIPLLEDVPLIERLSVNGSARYSEIESKHQDGRSVREDGFNYRLTGDWKINQLLRARASYGTSFRAPGLFEQFLANESSSLRQNGNDPCIGYDTALSQGDILQQTADNCASIGIPGDYPGAPISGSVLLGGGFGFLKPETSKNFTVGAVITPDFADLSLAIDYFDIEINDQISTLSARSIINGCYGSSNFPDEPLCAFVTRGQELSPPDPTVPFRIANVTATFINIDRQRNSGLDFTARYRQDTKWGPLRIGTQWSRQLTDEIDLLADSQTSFLNGGLGEPKWTGLGNITLEPKENLLLRYGFSYVGTQNTIRDIADNNLLSDDDLPEGGGAYTVQQDGQTVHWKTDLEAMFYHNLSAQYSLDDSWTIRAGVNNVFDEHPPAASFGAAAGNSPVVSQYDLRGRRFFLNVSKKFN